MGVSETGGRVAMHGEVYGRKECQQVLHDGGQGVDICDERDIKTLCSVNSWVCCPYCPFCAISELSATQKIRQRRRLMMQAAILSSSIDSEARP